MEDIKFNLDGLETFVGRVRKDGTADLRLMPEGFAIFQCKPGEGQAKVIWTNSEVVNLGEKWGLVQQETTIPAPKIKAHKDVSKA